MWRVLIGVLCLGIIVLAFVAYRYPSIVMDVLRGPVEPVAVFQAGSEDIIMRDTASYRQDDAAWAGDLMGSTSDTLGAYGCTLTSVANAVSNVTGQVVSPRDLNAKFGQIGGYTSRGWLIWSKVAEANEGVHVTVHDTPSHSAIEACMRAGAYPIVKIKLGGVIPHWVLLVGRKEGSYIMRDPLLGAPMDAPLPVSTRADKIFSLRCLSAS